MIKSISKLIDTNADWNTGTLTDVVAVNDSLELNIITIENENFETDLGGWQYFGAPGYSLSRVSDGGSYRAYISGESPGSGNSGMGKTFSIPNHDEVTLSFTWRAKSDTTVSTVTNAHLVILDADTDNELYSEGLITGGSLDTGYNNYYKDITSIISGYSNITIQLFLNDAWSADYNQQNWYDNINIIAGYTSGNRISQIDLSTVGTVDTSSISWTETLNGETITIETSVDDESTWQTATNGSSIPNLTDTDTTLDVRQTLSTTDTTVTPRLLDLYLEVTSSDTDITNINYGITSSRSSPIFKEGIDSINCRITSARNSPIFKYGGLSSLKGSLYWDDRSSPIFKEGIDSIIKVTFLPAKWRKAIEIINQWQTEAKPTNDWQSETKPNNIWEG